MKKKFYKNPWYVVPAAITLAVATFAVLMIAFPQPAAPPTNKVTVNQLLKYRGVDSTTSTRMIALKVFESTHTDGFIIYGTGSVSSSNHLVELISYESNGGLQQIVISHDAIRLHVRPGPATVKFILKNPKKVVYYRKVGDPLTKPYQSDYDYSYSRWSSKELLEKFANGADIYINQKMFDATYGGIS